MEALKKVFIFFISIGFVAFLASSSFLFSLSKFTDPDLVFNITRSVQLDEIKVTEIDDYDLIEKYGEDATIETIIVDYLTEFNIKKENATKLVKTEKFHDILAYCIYPEIIDENSSIEKEIENFFNDPEIKKIIGIKIDKSDIKDFVKLVEHTTDSEPNDDLSEIEILKVFNFKNILIVVVISTLVLYGIIFLLYKNRVRPLLTIGVNYIVGGVMGINSCFVFYNAIDNIIQDVANINVLSIFDYFNQFFRDIILYNGAIVLIGILAIIYYKRNIHKKDLNDGISYENTEKADYNM